MIRSLRMQPNRKLYFKELPMPPTPGPGEVQVRMAFIRYFILTVQIWGTCSVISSGICSMEDPTVVEEVTVSTVMEMVDFISITATDRVPADSDRMAILETLAAAAVLAEVSSGRKEATFMQMSP